MTLTETKPKALDFGCGNHKLADDRYEVIGVDAHPGAGVDVLCDFDEARRLPFADDTFALVYLSHVLEHVSEPRRLLLEAHRVAGPGGTILVRVPHHSNRWAYEVNHRRYFNYYSLDCLTMEGGKSAEARRCFAFKRREIKITPRFVTRQRWWQAARDRAVERFANRYPHRYEAGLYTLFPAYELIFELTAQK
jgi:SAM-dependent methyltransferase